MDQITLSDIMQWIGGGSVITLALATLKAVQNTLQEVKDLRRDLGHTDPAAPTGLAARVIRIEDKYQTLRDWAIREGFDERASQ